jgi:outer membrane receptor protein involved in Fe transport
LGGSSKSRIYLTSPAYTAGYSFPIPEHTWALGFTYAQRSATVSLNFTGTGLGYLASSDMFRLLIGSTLVRLRGNTVVRMAVPSGYLGKSPGYTMSDLNAAYHLGRRFDATLQINNLTDFYRNDYGAAYVVPGRQSRVGLRLRL